MADASQKPARVLVVEDDQTLSGVIKYNLSKEGYTVLSAVDGVQALEVARAEKPDVILLDLMLPRLDGLEVCRILRKESNVPILMLTAKGEEVDRVVGLELGADDYMSKPFGVRELMARVRAMLRRRQIAKEEAVNGQNHAGVLKSGNLEMDQSRRSVTLAGKLLEFTPKEFDPAGFPAEEQRAGVQARTTARKGVGLRLRRGHAHRGCAYKLAAPEDRSRSPASAAAGHAEGSGLQI